MNKLMVIFFIVLMLVGCSSNNSLTSDGDHVESTPEKSAETALPSPTLPPSAEPLPTPSKQKTEAYLDTEKLKTNFGFADAEGRNILVTGHEKGLDQEMAQLNEAIGDQGNVLKVKFNKWQDGTENSNVREMAHNFVNLAGYLFTVEEASATPDETYYLTDQTDFKVDALLPIESLEGQEAISTVEESVRQRIVDTKKREIQKIWKLADLSTDRQLYLVQFVRLDQDMLFSLVWKEKDEFTFMDYPAVIQGDEYSVWRVDDGGEVMPEMFSILFAAETSEGPLLGMNWWGSEGVNTFFLKKEGDSFMEMDIQYGRYTSPL
ncbi:hypothetical protein NYE25_01445 [Paenibacillus sp. FSL E2-8871]|uniref:hypothetical protein n=1 Tax=Paenibacillus sp. FSL E2-8871 TaxID=2975326 RepID=UPI0030FB316C